MALRPQVWLFAAAGVAAALAIGLPAALIPSPFFDRPIPARPVDYIVWLASAALIGALAATYRYGTTCAVKAPQEGLSGAAGDGRLTVGGVLSFLAVGCPTCNKLVVLALGSGGALTYFAPLQPLVGLASVGLLGVTLAVRLRALGGVGWRRAAGQPPLEHNWTGG